jgi:hypothetical protein
MSLIRGVSACERLSCSRDLRQLFASYTSARTCYIPCLHYMRHNSTLRIHSGRPLERASIHVGNPQTRWRPDWLVRFSKARLAAWSGAAISASRSAAKRFKNPRRGDSRRVAPHWRPGATRVPRVLVCLAGLKLRFPDMV